MVAKIFYNDDVHIVYNYIAILINLKLWVKRHITVNSNVQPVYPAGQLRLHPVEFTEPRYTLEIEDET